MIDPRWRLRKQLEYVRFCVSIRVTFFLSVFLSSYLDVYHRGWAKGSKKDLSGKGILWIVRHTIFGFIVFVILYTRYYMRSIWDDRSFSCLNFNRDSSRYVTFKASEEFIDPFFSLFSFSRNLHREYIDFDPFRCKQSINTSVIRAQTRIELAKDGAREQISERACTYASRTRYSNKKSKRDGRRWSVAEWRKKKKKYRTYSNRVNSGWIEHRREGDSVPSKKKISKQTILGQPRLASLRERKRDPPPGTTKAMFMKFTLRVIEKKKAPLYGG